MKSRNNKTIEYKVYGDEPLWNIPFKDDISRDVAMMKALTWYSVMSDDAEHKKWFQEYVKNKNYDKPKLSKLLSVSDVKIRYGDSQNPLINGGFNAGIYARLTSLGAPLPKSIVDGLEASIEHFLATTTATIVEETKESSQPEITIADRINHKSGNIIFQIDEMLDCILTSGKIMFPDITVKTPKISQNTSTILENNLQKLTVAGSNNTGNKKKNVEIPKIPDIDVDKWLSQQLTKSVYAKKVKDHFSNSLKEFTSSDPDLTFAYSVYRKDHVKEAANFVKKVFEICDKSEKLSNSMTKVRKRRMKSPVDLVKKLKFANEDSFSGTKSISATKIIGSSKFVIYNTKYRTVTLIESDSPDGLSVKGKTIIGIDEKKSFTKKLRKPKEFFKEVDGKGIRAFKSAFDSLKCKPSPAKGRISDVTILYGAY